MPTKSGRRTTPELRAAVRRGIALLDEKLPEVWRRILKTREFKFNNRCNCVIGLIGQCQIRSESRAWDRGMGALGLTNYGGYAEHYGFDIWHNDELPILAKLWKQAIRTGKV